MGVSRQTISSFENRCERRHGSWKYTIQLVLSYCVCLLLAAYWIIYVILSRKY